MFVLKVKTKLGQEIVRNLTPESTTSELKTTISGITNIPPSRLNVLSGFPPKPLDLSSDSSSLKSIGILSGDTLIIEEKPQAILNVLSGFPPKLLDLSSDSSSLKSKEIASGDTVIIEQKQQEILNVLSGFPPKLLDLSSDSPSLKSKESASGDTLIIEEKQQEILNVLSGSPPKLLDLPSDSSSLKPKENASEDTLIIEEEQQEILNGLSGFPPKLLDLTSDSSSLKSKEIASGDTVIIEEKQQAILNVLSGFPPKLIDLSSDSSSLKSKRIASGDTLIIKEKQQAILNVLSGFPPKLIDLSSDSPSLKSKEIASGDTLIIEEKQQAILNVLSGFPPKLLDLSSDSLSLKPKEIASEDTLIIEEKQQAIDTIGSGSDRPETLSRPEIAGQSVPQVTSPSQDVETEGTPKQKRQRLGGASKRNLRKLLDSGVPYETALQQILDRKNSPGLVGTPMGKRSHSDESISEPVAKRPKLATTQQPGELKASPAKANRPSYKATGSGVRVGLIHPDHPARQLSTEQVSLLLQEVMSSVDQLHLTGFQVRFEGCAPRPGWLLITCADDHSAEWLLSIVDSLRPWRGARIKAVTGRDVPRPPICIAYIPDDEKDVPLSRDTVLSRLQVMNRTLSTTEWTVLNHTRSGLGHVWTFGLDEGSVKALEELGWRPYFGFGRVKFRLKNKPEADSSASGKFEERGRTPGKVGPSGSGRGKPSETFIRSSPRGHAGGMRADRAVDYSTSVDETDWGRTPRKVGTSGSGRGKLSTSIRGSPKGYAWGMRSDRAADYSASVDEADWGRTPGKVGASGSSRGKSSSSTRGSPRGYAGGMRGDKAENNSASFEEAEWGRTPRKVGASGSARGKPSTSIRGSPRGFAWGMRADRAADNSASFEEAEWARPERGRTPGKVGASGSGRGKPSTSVRSSTRGYAGEMRADRASPQSRKRTN